MRMATQKFKTSALSWAGLLLTGCFVTLAQAQQSLTQVNLHFGHAVYMGLRPLCAVALAGQSMRL